MNPLLIHKRFITFFFALAIVSIGFAQKADQILPQTIIFKVKEQYRTVCSKNEIKNQQFIQTLSALGIDELVKVFPNKQKEDKEGFIDLSLIYQLKYTNSFSEEAAIYKLNQTKLFEYVEPYVLPQLTYTPNDTNIPTQYYLTLINAFNAWNINQGDTNIVVGITDTGWEPTHPDLLANVKINYADPINGSDDDGDGYIDNYMGWDVGVNDNDATFQSTSHGVNVTGLATAVTDNTTGIASAGFKSKFLPIKISDAAGMLTQAYQGVVYAADHGCFVINCSWGGYTPGQFQRDIINYAIINKGSLVIAAVGNDNQENVFYPAGYDGVLSVAASEQNDLKKNNSNYGYYVDISAPGEAMFTTAPNGNFSFNGGTSMASPVVAGGAALVKAQFPSYTNQQIAALLRATADDLNGLNPTYVDKLGSGRLDLFDAMNTASPQFVELTSKTLTDNNNTIFEVGDTINIVGLFTNYLSTITGLTVTLSSASPFINIVDGATNLPNLNMLDTVSNFSDAFLIEVLIGAAQNEVILIQANITNGSYTHNQYFTLTLNQDFINLEENLVSTSITSKGKIGYNDINNSIGLGFTYKGTQMLYEAGLMVGDASNRVADEVRGATGQDQDFLSAMNVQFNPPYVSALDLKGIMNDGALVTPMDLTITHFEYAFPTTPDDKYVIVLYDIENAGTSTLTNLYAGIFADWDITNPNVNKAGMDATLKMGYAYSYASDSTYAAIKVLSSGTFVNYAIDLDGSDPTVNPNNAGYSGLEKYTTLSTNRNTAGGVNGADVAHVVSSGSFSLAPGQHVSVAFAIIGGDSLLDIEASAVAAQNQYDANPLSVGEIDGASDIQVYPNPTNGIVYVKSEKVIAQIVIKNVLGETIITSKSKTIDLSNYSNGVYFVEVKTATSSFVQKVLLTK